MKKRFTVMLDEKTIKELKFIAGFYTPTGFRELLEDNLKLFTKELEKQTAEEIRRLS